MSAGESCFKEIFQIIELYLSAHMSFYHVFIGF